LVDDIDNILRKYDIYFEIIPYTPHMTVAGRDLTKEGFELLQKELQTFEFNTTVLIDSFSLVLAPCKENNISTMQEIKRFQLQDNTLHSTI
jgi:2'-5' RNA ligase